RTHADLARDGHDHRLRHALDPRGRIPVDARGGDVPAAGSGIPRADDRPAPSAHGGDAPRRALFRDGHGRPRGAAKPRGRRPERRARRGAHPGRGPGVIEQIPAGTWSPSAARLRLGSWLPPLGVSIVVLVLWEVVFFELDIKSFLLPRPSVIVGQLIALWPTTLMRGVIFTGSEALAGLAVGVLLGTLGGLGTARWAFARETVVPLAIGASTIPIIAFAPITLNWFGPESPLPRVIIVALRAFFPVLVNR